MSSKYVQCDRQVVDARFFVEKILRFVNSPELQSWDFTSGDESMVAGIYRRLMDIMMEEWKVNEYALFKILDTAVTHKQKEMKGFYKRALAEIKGRKWGKLHRLHFSHLSKNEDWVFSPEIAGIGDNHSVDPGTSKWNNEKKEYEQFSGASMRMIIEMSEKPQVYLSLPGLNREYEQSSAKNPWRNWKDCQYELVDYQL
jgi:hypothetical protein